jgi:fatty acid desaturase
MRAFHLLIFPSLQIAFMALAAYFILNENYVLAFSGVFIAAFFLNFTLHVTIHYQVHFMSKSKIINLSSNLISSLLMGLPFAYYEMLHWNHHRHNNNIDDFTSTWKLKNEVPVPKKFITYSFLWPFNSKFSIKAQFAKAIQEGYFHQKKIKKLRFEAFIILAFYIILLFNSVPLLITYILIIYLGWVMITMHNYGQHLPEVYNTLKANSYYNRFYNFLSLNNGLHNEHHEQPQLKYWELTELKMGEVNHPHLVEGFYFSKGKAKKGVTNG